MDISVFMWALLGNLGWVHLPGLKIWLKGAKGMECLSPWGSVKGTWRGLPPGDPEGYLEKALEMGISLHGGSAFGEPGGGIIYGGL
jgi:hypothetical protein